MNSQTTPEFWDCYRALPPEVRRLAVRTYQMWRDNPRHPSLHFKSVHSSEPIYSARVGIHWRALGLREGDPSHGSGSAHTPTMTA